MADRICVAQIGAAHGLRGEVKLRSFTEDPRAVTAYGPLESEDGARRFEIEMLRPAGDHFVARLAGVSDRDAAGDQLHTSSMCRVTGCRRSRTTTTFYLADLIDLPR